MIDFDRIEHGKRLWQADKHPADEVWRLHCVDAMPPSEIAMRTGRDEDDVRRHIVELWYQDKTRGR